MSELTGQILANRYRVETFLGRGGMADVYKVWDQRRSTYLALKVLHEDLAEDNVFLRRFKREAQTLARLQHPNIVRFYGLEEDGDLAFLLMDFIEGTTLRKEIHRLNGQPFPLQRILEIIRPICAALNYAHQSGFVHCDVKPANIMIQTNGTALISDFGIARMSEAATATLVGAGTPAYMAPEQARGENPTPQTDIYALGVVLFEMLTGGERPFTGENAKTTGSTSEKIRWEQMKLEPPSPRKYNLAISPQLEAILLRCINKNPATRYSTTLELLVALDMALRPPQTKAESTIVQSAKLPKPIPTYQPQASQNQTISSPPKSMRTAWTVMGSILLVCALLIFGAASISTFEQQARANAINTVQAKTAIMKSTSEAEMQATNIAGVTIVAQTQEALQTETAEVNAINTREMAATSTARTSLGPYPSWRLLLNNSFGERASSWYTGDLDDEYATINRKITNGKYIWTIIESKQGFFWHDYSSLNWNFTDFYISVDVQVISGQPSDCYALDFRDNGNQNFYIFEVCGSQYRVLSSSSGWKFLLGPKTASAIASGQNNKLAIAARGNHFEFYINNQLVDTLDDNQFPNGQVGVAIEANKGDTPTFEFTNFVVGEPY